MRTKVLVALGLVVLALVPVSGYLYGALLAYRLSRTLARPLEAGAVVIEPGEVTTAIGFFSASARLTGTRIRFDRGLVRLPATTVAPERNAIQGAADAAQITLAELPDVDIALQGITFRLERASAATSPGHGVARVRANTVRVDHDLLRLAGQELSITAERKDHELWDRVEVALTRLTVGSKRGDPLDASVEKLTWTQQQGLRGERRLAVGMAATVQGVELGSTGRHAGQLRVASGGLKVDLEIDGDRRTSFPATLAEALRAPNPVYAYSRAFNPLVLAGEATIETLSLAAGATQARLDRLGLTYREHPQGDRLEKIGTAQLTKLDAKTADGMVVTLEEARAESESSASPALERAMLEALEPRTAEAPSVKGLGALLDYLASGRARSRGSFRALQVREQDSAAPLVFPEGSTELEGGFDGGVGALVWTSRVRTTGLTALAARLPYPPPADAVAGGLKLSIRGVDVGAVRTLVAQQEGSAPASLDLADGALRALLRGKPGLSLESTADTDDGFGTAIFVTFDLDRPLPAGFRLEQSLGPGAGATVPRALLDASTFQMRVVVHEYRKLMAALDVVVGPGTGQQLVGMTRGVLVPRGNDLVAELVIRERRGTLNGQPSPLVDALLGSVVPR